MESGRRHRVSFDASYFERRAGASPLSATEAFRHAWASNLWGGAESPSGPGSGLDQTAGIRTAIPLICRRLGVRRLLDVPCGDFHWMSQVPLGDVAYVGGDLLPELAAENQRRHGGPGRTFQALDLTASALPAADLLLTRDCLVHLSFADAARAIANIRQSAISYLLATTFPAQTANEDVVTGDWRPLNLALPPFAFPPPVEVIAEGCTEQDGLFADKSLGLWRVVDL